jgi:hypothetical protein
MTRNSHRNHSTPLILSTLFAASAALAATGIMTSQNKAPAAKKPSVHAPAVAKKAAPKLPDGAVLLKDSWTRVYDLAAGKAVEISVHLDRPSSLPPNGRVAVEWGLEGGKGRDARRKSDCGRGRDRRFVQSKT